MKAVTAKDVADEYTSSLADLTINSKPLINMLTMLAEDYLHHAQVIVKVVETHIQKVRSEIKLPVLYLIDSIVKNVGKDYLLHFTQNIVSIFCGVFEKVDERVRSQMFKLRQTWNDVFPQNKLFALDVRVHAIDPAWPITASTRRIHVNPKFLQAAVHADSSLETSLTIAVPTTSPETPQINDGVIREELLKQQKELLELQKRKVELELMQTKAILEEQQKKLENQAAVFISEQPEVKNQKSALVSAVSQLASRPPPQPRHTVPRQSQPHHMQPRHIQQRHQVPRHHEPTRHHPLKHHIPRHHVSRQQSPRRSPVHHSSSPLRHSSSPRHSPQRYSPTRHASPRHSPARYSPQHAHISNPNNTSAKTKSHKSGYRSRDPRIKRNRDKILDIRSKFHSAHAMKEIIKDIKKEKKEKKGYKKLKERHPTPRSSSAAKVPQESKSEVFEKKSGSSSDSLFHKKRIGKYDKELRTKLPCDEPPPPGVDITLDSTYASDADEGIEAQKDNTLTPNKVDNPETPLDKETASMLSNFSSFSLNSSFSPLSCSTTIKSDQNRTFGSSKEEDYDCLEITAKKEAGKLRSKGGDTYSFSPISKEIFIMKDYKKSDYISGTSEYIQSSSTTKEVEKEKLSILESKPGPSSAVFEPKPGPSSAVFEKNQGASSDVFEPIPGPSSRPDIIIPSDETVTSSSFKDVDFRMYSSLGRKQPKGDEKEKKMELLFGGEDVDLRVSTPANSSSLVPPDSCVVQDNLSDDSPSEKSLVVDESFEPSPATSYSIDSPSSIGPGMNLVTSSTDKSFRNRSLLAEELSKNSSNVGLNINIDSNESKSIVKDNTSTDDKAFSSSKPLSNPSSYITPLTSHQKNVLSQTVTTSTRSVPLKSSKTLEKTQAHSPPPIPLTPPAPPIPPKPPTPPQPPTSSNQSVTPNKSVSILNQPLPPVTPSPPPPPIISKDDVAKGSSWANYKRNKNEDTEKTSAKRDSHKHSTKKDKTSRTLFRKDELDDLPEEDIDEHGERNSSANCSLIIKEAEHQLSTGNITFSQYNRMLKEVIAINEERKLQEVLLKDKIDSKKISKNVKKHFPGEKKFDKTVKTEMIEKNISDKSRVTPSPDSGPESFSADKGGKSDADSKSSHKSARKRSLSSNGPEERKRFKSIYYTDHRQSGKLNSNNNGVIYNSRNGSQLWFPVRPPNQKTSPPLPNGPNSSQMGLRPPGGVSQMGQSRYYWTAHPSPPPQVFYDKGPVFRYVGPPSGPGGHPSRPSSHHCRPAVSGGPNTPSLCLLNNSHCLPNGSVVANGSCISNVPHCLATNGSINISNGPVTITSGLHNVKGSSLTNVPICTSNHQSIRGPGPGNLDNCISRCSRSSESTKNSYLLRANADQVSPALPSIPVPSTTPPLSKRQDLPPADPHVLEMIEKDGVRWIEIDGIVSEVRFYGETAVVLTGWSDAREVFFQDGSRRLIIDGREQFVLSFNDPYREIIIDKKVYKVRLGAPTRELFMDGLYYEVAFGGPPIQVMLGGRIRTLQISGPMPKVKIGDRPRTDLLVGKINLIVDARNMFPIYLDAKPQKFEVNGYPYILRFVEALRTVVINGVPFNFEYGGSPVPIYFRGERHFLRLSVLPHNVIPGYVNIVNMEGGRLPSPAPRPITPPKRKPTDDSWWIQDDTAAGNEQSLELLTSLMPTTTANVALQSYSIEQPSSNEGSSGSHAFGNVNVGELFQKLVATGIVPPVAEKNNKANEQKNPIEPVDFSKPETLKVKKQPGLIARLYSGIQCSSCGVRFPPEHTVKYSQHLDWHFRQNRRDRMSFKVARSRRWNYDVSDWIQFQEIEDDDDKIVSWFELQDKNRNGKQQKSLAEEPTALVDSESARGSCVVCHDEFEIFFNHDKEEWHFRNAIINEDKYYHPQCYQEFLENRATVQELSEAVLNGNNLFFIPDDSVLNINGCDKSEKDSNSDVEIVSFEKEVIELDSTIISNNGDTSFEVEPDVINSENPIISQVVISDDIISEVTNSENLGFTESENLDINSEKSTITENHIDHNHVNHDDSDDDILGIEVLERKVELYEILDEDDDNDKVTYVPSKKHKCNSISDDEDIDEFDFSSIQIKTEKIDGLNSIPKINASKTASKVVSSIDGNNELGDAVPVVLPKNKIKINISSKHLQQSRIDSPKSPESVSTFDEELTPSSIKPKLSGKNLTINKPVNKGSELSSLCSIM